MVETVTASFAKLFGETARQRGNATAIEFSGVPVYSYSQLDWHARQIAARLTERGIGNEDIVGIAIQKSPQYIAAMLGIWYAGAAFLPLDPSLPVDRIALMCMESQTSVALAPQEQTDVAFLPESISSLSIGDIPQSCPQWRQPAWSAEQLAYVIFTSGSTGTPKGVLVTHAGVANFLQEQIRAFRIDSSSRSLFYLSTNFDAAVSDIGTILLAGGTLCIEPPCSLQPGPQLAPLVASRRITHIDIPPAVLKQLNCTDMPDCLQTLIIGGEACAPYVVREWSSRFHLVNVYGPTEATVCTSLGVCTPQWQRALIGQPLKGIEYIILDEDLQPVPVGQPGELFIAGEALARGYLNRPELTARKFIRRGSARLYRSGDRVIRHADGEFEFLGRIDRQFKLRGMLVEPEEIESALFAHPATKRAAVVKMAVGSGKRDALVAFLVCDPVAMPTEKELRAFLSQKLPRFLVPQRFVFLVSMPLTVTGKPDLQALQAMEPPEVPTDSSLCAQPEADGCNTIAILTQVYRTVLGLKHVDANDDLFDLGGDSFNVLEVIAEAELRGLIIPPPLLMANSRISHLAEALTQARDPDDGCDEADGQLALREAMECGAMSAVDLRRDVAIDKEWSDLVTKAISCCPTLPPMPENVLITGASGFLGSRLLYELLQATDARVSCLVRCRGTDEGLGKIEKALAGHGKGLNKEHRSRLQVLNGDLGQPHFGLDADHWRRLAEQIDTVYHCAAYVNMLLPYADLRASNVSGTFEIAKFVCQGRWKALHHASTLSVFVATDRNEGVAMEDDDLAATRFVYGGYAQTKWASEVFLRSLGDAGLDVSHYRFGLIVGDSQTGLTVKSDFLGLFVRGIEALQCLPEMGSEISVDITPVDFAARAMLQLSLPGQSLTRHKTFHIANPHGGAPLAMLAEAMVDSGIKIEFVTAQEFIARLAQRRQRDEALSAEESAACLALCRRLDKAGSFLRLRTMDLFQCTGITFDMTNTLSQLNGSLQCPPPDEQLLRVLVSGILQKPVPTLI